jgi:acylglycerol lipase
MKSVFGVERNIEDSNFPSEDEINALEASLPGGCVHGWFPSSYQNAQLHYRKWIPATTTRAIVIFMHGISTHSVKYVKLSPTADGATPRVVSTSLMVEKFLESNIAVYAFDMYGHGYSEGIRFFIPESYNVNVQDHIRFCHLVALENNDNDRQNPLFLMGESYGCTVTLHSARYFQDQTEPAKMLPNFDSMILTAPAVIGDLPIYPVLQFLKLLAKYYPQWRPFFMPNPISPDRIWRDPLVRTIYTNKTNPANIVDGQGIPFRLGTALQLLHALEDVREKVIPVLTTPFIAIHGTNDYGVPITGSNFLYKNALTTTENKELIMKEGAYHDLLADYVAEECMTNIISWINQRIAVSSGQKN